MKLILINIIERLCYYYSFVCNFWLINIRSKVKLITSNLGVYNQPVYFTGLGCVELGDNFMLGYKPGGRFRNGCIEIQPRYKSSKIIIGNNLASNNNLFICSANLVSIGDHVLIGENVTIFDHEAHGILPHERYSLGLVGSVKIGNNVWIGNNVMILKNSEIGDNSIVAAGAVVSGKYPSNVVIGGVPARLIKQIDI